MATKQHHGTSARFQYTATGSTSGSTHMLALPLRERVPADAKIRHEWWSADLTTRETVAIGSTSDVREMIGTVRLDDEPASLKTMLREALNNDVTLTYRESSGGTTYPAKVLRIVGSEAVELQPDRDRWVLGEWEVRLHLRRVDGGTFDGLL